MVLEPERFYHKSVAQSWGQSSVGSAVQLLAQSRHGFESSAHPLAGLKKLLLEFKPLISSPSGGTKVQSTLSRTSLNCNVSKSPRTHRRSYDAFLSFSCQMALEMPHSQHSHLKSTTTRLSLAAPTGARARAPCSGPTRVYTRPAFGRSSGLPKPSDGSAEPYRTTQ